MVTVKQLLKEKSTVWSIGPEQTVYDALKLMSDHNIGALPVLEGDRLVGVISERDYARKVILKDKSSLKTPVKEIMTEKVVTIRPEQTISECMQLMTDKRVRHLPVLDNQARLVGIISIGDVVKEIMAEQKVFIQDLMNYIEGRGYGQ
jgi:CBS domain-containing protein